jgi:deoxyribonuclease V
MQVKQLNDWDVTTAQATQIQERLAGQVECFGGPIEPRLIAGLDVSVERKGKARAAVVVLSYPDLAVVESVAVEGRVDFPYVPGLLSFREIPITLEACGKIRQRPDLLMVDGQGYSHPRRLGLASHLGLVLDTSTIGCAKSHYIGQYVEPGVRKGDRSELTADSGEVIGAVLRTRDNSRPLFISVGHRVSLSAAIFWVLQCCTDYRLPEPTRLAHLASRGAKF